MESEPQLSIVEIADPAVVEHYRLVDHKKMSLDDGPFIAFHVFITALVDGSSKLILPGGSVSTWILGQEMVDLYGVKDWIGRTFSLENAPDFVRCEFLEEGQSWSSALAELKSDGDVTFVTA